MAATVTYEVTEPQISITQADISPQGNNQQHRGMEDIYSIRRRNLIWVCTNKAGDNQSQLARDLGQQQPGLINRYLRGKAIGDDIARLVEKTYELPYGWMDNVHPTETAQKIALAYDSAPEEWKPRIERFMLEEAATSSAAAGDGSAPPKRRGSQKGLGRTP